MSAGIHPSTRPFKVSVPGRVCLFGEHQDFLGLAVIALAINRRIEIEARPRTDAAYHIHMPDLPDELALTPAEDISYEKSREYLRSGINVLKREGLEFRHGWDFTIHGDIPINAGCASSSALAVAWIAANLHTHGDPRAHEPLEIARLAHLAEVVEFNEPGGMMDHYTCSLGGLLYIDCADPISVTPLEADLPGLVLGDSGEKKDTMAVLARSRRDVETGVAALKARLPGFDLRTTPAEAVQAFLGDLPGDQREKLSANVVNRDICREALKELQAGPDLGRIGELLTRHHEMLRDRLGLSTPKIEAMIEAAMGAGALGGKLNGSGGGGTMIALAPGRAQEAIKAIEKASGQAWPVKRTSGIGLQVLHDG
jgi:galactokinase